MIRMSLKVSIRYFRIMRIIDCLLDFAEVSVSDTAVY